MKYCFLIITVVCSLGNIHAQDITDLKAVQAEKMGMIADLQAQIDAANGEVSALQKEIDLLSGWRKGVGGLIGFDWNRSNGWIANPNPKSRSSKLNLDLNGYLLNDREKTFWHNRGTLVKAWNDLDLSQADLEQADDGLFDNGTADILNISSLAGYKILDNLALSGQAELNSSLTNFLKPGTIDFGLGATWLPIENMTILIHPLNYNIAFPAEEEMGIETTGSLGAKIRADYFRDFIVQGKNVHWTTTFTAFAPYSSFEAIILDDGSEVDKATNYTWLNNFTFEVWKGIGVGLGWGLRKAIFESKDFQSYTSFGLSYKI